MIYENTVRFTHFALGKEDVADFTFEQLVDGCRRSGFNPLPLRDEHIIEIKNLKKPDDLVHKDPFDRLLLCQAKAEGMGFLTHDSCLKRYDESCIIGF